MTKIFYLLNNSSLLLSYVLELALNPLAGLDLAIVLLAYKLWVLCCCLKEAALFHHLAYCCPTANVPAILSSVRRLLSKLHQAPNESLWTAQHLALYRGPLSFVRKMS